MANCTSPTIRNGRIRRVIPSSGGPLDTIPANLADTGCVIAGNPRSRRPGMVPFSVNAPFWSDGASKERYLAIPDGTTIGIAQRQRLRFPGRDRASSRPFG